MCGQFADLMEAVNGINTYEILCEVALGLEPSARTTSGASTRWRPAFRGGTSPMAWSGRHRVRSTVARLQRQTAASLIAIYYQPGQRLSASPKHSDGFSYRYATINIAAAERSAFVPLVDQVEARLGFDIG